MGTINVVLYQPEIPQNTGNIMRTCVATNTVLHLIEPLGFSLDEKEIKRSGANYVKDVVYHRYSDWNDFINKNNPKNIYYLTRYGQKHLYDVGLEFGCDCSGYSVQGIFVTETFVYYCIMSEFPIIPIAWLNAYIETNDKLCFLRQ